MIEYRSTNLGIASVCQQESAIRTVTTRRGFDTGPIQ